jgi:hypothetical protein
MGLERGGLRGVRSNTEQEFSIDGEAAVVLELATFVFPCCGVCKTARSILAWTYSGFLFLSCVHIPVFNMAAPFDVGGGDSDDTQLLQQQVLSLNQRLRILEGECKELDKARTAEKAQRERSSAIGGTVCRW